MENGPFIDGLPIENGDFPWQTVSHNQMVTLIYGRYLQFIPYHQGTMGWFLGHGADGGASQRGSSCMASTPEGLVS